jgi:hypothetical protein
VPKRALQGTGAPRGPAGRSDKLSAILQPTARLQRWSLTSLAVSAREQQRPNYRRARDLLLWAGLSAACFVAAAVLARLSAKLPKTSTLCRSPEAVETAKTLLRPRFHRAKASVLMTRAIEYEICGPGWAAQPTRAPGLPLELMSRESGALSPVFRFFRVGPG